MNRRMGKFYMHRSLVDGGESVEILKLLDFNPHRVEYLYYADKFEYFGTSPLFELIETGRVVPEYTFELSSVDGDTKINKVIMV